MHDNKFVRTKFPHPDTFPTPFLFGAKATPWTINHVGVTAESPVSGCKVRAEITEIWLYQKVRQTLNDAALSKALLDLPLFQKK